jgi:hypothetical protein
MTPQIKNMLIEALKYLRKGIDMLQKAVNQA